MTDPIQQDKDGESPVGYMQASTGLRWKNGVLQQEWHGSDGTVAWIDVPDADAVPELVTPAKIGTDRA